MTDDPADRPTYTLTSADVLYEDSYFIAINKPAPLLTQAPPGVPCLEAAVKLYIKERMQKPAGVYLGIPHRLDRPVSGVIVFARNTKAAQRIHKQFEDRTVEKVYWAAVEGTIEPPEGTWKDHVRKIEGEARTQKAEPTDPGAKLAILNYRVISTFENGTILELHPQTGRMHQLRVQSAWRGYPVLGDAFYGGTRPFGPPAETPREQVIALHARKLTIAHPATKERMTFEAPLPAYWPEVRISHFPIAPPPPAG